MVQNTGGGYEDVFIDLNLTEFSANHIIFTFFRWCGQIGDTLFVAVSAYFLCDDEKLKLNKPIRIMLDTWVLSIISLIIAFFFMIPGKGEIVKSVLPIRYSVNWFVGCYIIYYLIHPLLNRAMKDIEQKTFKKIVLVLFVFYSVMGCIQQQYYYTSLVGFICIHYFVMYCKKYCVGTQDKGSAVGSRRGILFAGNVKKDIFAIVLSIAAILIWIIALNFAGKYIEAFSDKGLLACTYMNPAIILIGIASLDIAVHAKPREIKWANAITKYSLLIYLLHGSYFWLTYGKYAFYQILSSMGIPLLGRPCIIALIYVVITPVISAVYCKISDRALDKISTMIAKKCM